MPALTYSEWLIARTERIPRLLGGTTLAFLGTRLSVSEIGTLVAEGCCVEDVSRGYNLSLEDATHAGRYYRELFR